MDKVSVLNGLREENERLRGQVEDLQEEAVALREAFKLTGPASKGLVQAMKQLCVDFVEQRGMAAALRSDLRDALALIDTLIWNHKSFGAEQTEEVRALRSRYSDT